jgi:hypothetical protein
MATNSTQWAPANQNLPVGIFLHTCRSTWASEVSPVLASIISRTSFDRLDAFIEALQVLPLDIGTYQWRPMPVRQPRLQVARPELDLSTAFVWWLIPCDFPSQIWLSIYPVGPEFRPVPARSQHTLSPVRGVACR